MYDLTNPKSLERIPEWIQLLKQVKLTIPTMSLRNKVDLINNRQVSKDGIASLSKTYNITLPFEISAKSDTNIDLTFNELVKGLLRDNNNAH